MTYQRLYWWTTFCALCRRLNSIVWTGGVGVWVVLAVGGKLQLASWLVTIPWLIAISGVSSVMYWSVMSAVDGLMAPQTSRTNFCRYIRSRSEFYFRNRVYITTFSCSWPRDHGGRRSYTRTGRNGRRIGFPGRWNRIQLAGQPDRSVQPTLLSGSESIFITGNFVKRLLTDLGKFGQSAEARMWLFTITASSKTTGFLSEKCGN